MTTGYLADFAERPSLPAAFRSALAGDEYLRQLWTAGEHAGGDKSRSGADAALANALGRLLLSRGEFAVVLAAFAHGQPRPLPARQVERLWRLSQTPPDGAAAGDKADDWTAEDDKPRWTSGDAHEGKNVIWMWESGSPPAPPVAGQVGRVFQAAGIALPPNTRDRAT